MHMDYLFELCCIGLKAKCTMKPPNFKGEFQGTYLINPGLPWYIYNVPWP